MTTQTQPDLTHAEAIVAFREMAQTIGPKAELYPGLSVNRHSADGNLHTAIYPEGILAKGLFHVKADTYRETLAKVAAEWEARGATYIATTIREMALAIITITADLGECTDAALRAKFDAADIARYGERACEQATSMASNGPFSIVKLTGANDAEAA
ncbi:MAG: hypothetical protein V4820_11835 [Pseudomonadota bacterium]